MNRHNRSKLNQLLQNWPHGTVAVASWLREQGISRQLADQYCKSGWLESLGKGAFKKKSDAVTWEGALYAIQSQLGKSIHVGGKTALTQSGYGHFVEMGRSMVWLFGKPRDRLPTWFQKYDWGVDIKFLTTNLFFPDETLSLEQNQRGTFSVQMSSPARAIMEMLHLVPQHHSYEESSLIMEGLSTLRPDLVSQLLKQCQSIKVKRLFMVLAEKFNYPWVEKLDLTGVYFGNGKRVVVVGGHLNTKYNITVSIDEEVA